jgi:two-component sensor histidine kinase
VADEELPRTRASAQRVFANEEPVRGFVNSQNTPRGRREVLWNAQALTDPDGTVIGIQATGRDITAMKERERQLEKLNQEKELLVNEVNHRVKNNLAVVASLVRLKDDDLGADTDLSDVAHQVEAIRIVHEKLYKGGDVTHIEMRSYIEELLGTVFSSPAGRAVEINTEIGEIKLPSKIAVSLGLIINELATNALKYGSSRSENARFELSFTQVTRREEYTLVIANSGDPIPETVSLDNPSTLGLRLISSLVRQIDGTISMERTPRPTFTICFAINEDR